MSKNTDQAAARRRRHRLILLAVVIILALPVLGAAVLIASFNPNRYAPQIIAAVARATGRQLTIGGPIRLRLSLSPLIEARSLSLANPPGFPDANLVTLDRVDAQLALLPLLLSHRLDILHLHLVGPNIVLERNAAGTPDWILGPATPATTPTSSVTPAPGAAPAAQAQKYTVALQEVDISNGQLTIKNKVGAPVIISLPSFTGTATALDAPLRLKASAEIDATPFTLAGTVGPVARLFGTGTGPWPVDLTFTLSDATAHVSGTIAHPLNLKGYDATVSADIPALNNLTGSLPPAWIGGLALPPVQNLTASARIVDQNSLVPAIDHLVLKAGVADLSVLRPGLMLNSLDIEMASLDQPLSLNAAATLDGTALTLTGRFGPPQALLPTAWLPASMPPQTNYPVTAKAAFGNASLTVNGAIATPETLAGAALALNATIPDLAALSPLTGSPLPAWKNISAQTTLVDPGGQGLRNAIGLQGLAVTIDNAAFGGDASLFLAKPANLKAALTASQVNLDALLAAMPHTGATAAPVPSPAAPQPNAGAQSPAVSGAKIPVLWLHEGNADLQLSANTLVWNHTTYSALQAHAVLNNGVLTLAPVTGQLPGGSVTASAVIDASHDPATESLKLNAPAMAVAPLLKTFNLPNDAQGTVQVQLNASASGDSLKPITASLNGQFGLAMVNGMVDGTVLNQMFGSVLNTVNLPTSMVGSQGPVAVRCMAARLDATNGIGTFRALALDSSRLRMQGSGTVNFSNDALNLTLRPQVRISGTNLAVPVHVGGTIAAPTTSLAPGRSGPQSLLGELAGDLGLGGAQSAADICPAALSLARMGQPGPAPGAMTSAPTSPAALPAGPTNLLKSIFGK
ncbi:AsmA family protein [Acidocella sp.]|jgi:AsmA protein|uniref:AsmA family protein n=1 Tax=Acidocella sp. TaxID=50710 RepID=UPI002F426A7B